MVRGVRAGGPDRGPARGEGPAYRATGRKGFSPWYCSFMLLAGRGKKQPSAHAVSEAEIQPTSPQAAPPAPRGPWVPGRLPRTFPLLCSLCRAGPPQTQSVHGHRAVA